MALSISQFGKKVKSKYPDYADIPDEELGRRMLEKHPEYGDMVSTSTSEQKTPRLFTEKDPEILLETATGFIPGVNQTRSLYDKETSPEEKLRIAREISNPMFVPTEITKGLAGIIPRLGLTASDLLGGPRKLDIPFIGEQQSAQETSRQLQEQGAGQAVSFGLPATQTILDLLLARGGAKMLKRGGGEATPEVTKVEQKLLPAPSRKAIEVPPEGFSAAQELTGNRPPPVPVEYLREQPTLIAEESGKVSLRDMKKPPIEEPLPKSQPLEEAVNLKQRGGFKTLVDEVFLNMDEKLMRMGKSGKELADRYNSALGESGYERGQWQTLIDKEIPKLNKKQQDALFNLRENGVMTSDVNVLKVNDFMDRFYSERLAKGNEVGILVNDQTGLPIGDPKNYISHQLNEAGIEALRQKPKNFFKEFAEHNKMSELDARKLWLDQIQGKFVPKAGFERVREYKIPSKYMETDPNKILSRYNEQFAERYGLAKNFGKDYEIADDLAAKVGMEGGDQAFAKRFVDYVGNRASKDFEAEATVSNLNKRIVQTKLTPMSALPNFAQGMLANTHMFGARNATFSMLKALTPEGKAWAKEIGALGESFYKDFSIENKIWKKTSGFPLTEDLNYITVSNGARKFIETAYGKLRKNPNDKFLSAKLDDLRVPEWRESLAKGEPLTKKQIGIGSFQAVVKSIFPKESGKIPEWTINPVGRATYLFNHYQFQNPKFLLSEFKFGKGHGLKSLLRTSTMAAIIGEPIANILAFVKGEDRSDNVIERVVDNILTVQGGVPFQLAKSASQFGGFKAGLSSLGGPVMSGAISTAADLMKEIGQGDVPSAVSKTSRHFLRGDIPFGPRIPSGAMIDDLLFGRK